ncbi:MAG TPA: superoxide dismutase family protein [Candidatus Limnocylindria bacterium]|jgi:Cu-Zn family superoxide dismutase
MRSHLLSLLAVVAVVVACGGATTTPLTATAELKDKDGTRVATAVFTEAVPGAGVKIAITVTKLPAGQHGWHLHTVGKCDPPDFASAGAHFNLDSHQHGSLNPQGPHAGDLGNLSVAADGTAKAELVAKLVTLEAGHANSLFKTDGTAIVVHADPDDEKTDPSGNSGARIACGVIGK